MNTKELNKTEYPSPYHYNARNTILELVKKEESYIQTVSPVEGTLGKPIYQEVEWNVYG